MKRPAAKSRAGAKTKAVCVASLREAGYANLEEWLRDEKNLYVGRRGRIFIHTTGSKRVFHYSGSKWQNPFVIGGKLTRQQACERFKCALLDGSLKDPEDGSPLRAKVSELRGRRLGCWCLPEPCHAQILAELAEAKRLAAGFLKVVDPLSRSKGRLQMQPFTVDQTKVIIRPPVVLVAQFGGPRPSFQRFVHVIRAESLPEESFLLEVELLANNGDGCVLVAQRTDSQSGPDPVYHHSLCLDWDDEGDMAVNCKVMRTSLTSSETFAELREKLPQAALEPVGRSERLEMRCLDGTGTNAEVSLHFADVMPEMSLNITISSATGLAPKSEAWTFNPFVEACVFSRDPRLGSLGRAARVVFGQTEILSNCHSDPHWEQPIVLKIVPEPGLFLRLSACSEAALGVTRAWDELAEVVMEMPEVMKLAQGSVERKYTMKRLFEMKRHGDSELFMSFAQVGGNVAAAAFERTAAAHATRTRDGGVASPRAGRPVQGELMASGSPTSKHTAVQLPIAGGYALPPQPSIQGLQPLAQVLTVHGQEVPDVIAQLYGPPQQPRYLQSAGWPAPPPPPASAKPSPLPPEELSLALFAGAKAGAQVKGNVPMSFFSLPGNPHLAVLDTRSGEVSVAESKKYILQVISEESFQSTPSHSKMERLISYLRKKRRRAKAKLSTFLQDQGFKRHVNSRRRRWMSYTYPLHVAVAQNNAEIASLLLDCGADPDARDSWGRTPRQLAERASPEVRRSFAAHRQRRKVLFGL
ncbi:unnamed protein product [Effrenium voratum]|nr:unnamed protein product [Effrenium voratum]